MSLGIAMNLPAPVGLAGLLAVFVWIARSWATGRQPASADRRAVWAAIRREVPPDARLTALEPESYTVVELGDREQYVRETRGGR